MGKSTVTANDIATVDASQVAKPKGLVPAVKSSLPAAGMQAETFRELAESTTFLGRLQLFTGTSKYINARSVQPGEWGIPGADTKVTVLGDTCDFVVLARRAKAVDLSDTSDIITSYDPNSDEFKRIANQSAVKDSGCMYGVSFLVYERQSNRFLEYYAGSKTSRNSCGDLYPFLPENHAADATELTAVTASTKAISKGSRNWHGPIFEACSTPIKLPSEAKVAEELEKFLNPEVEETVDEGEDAATDRER